MNFIRIFLLSNSFINTDFESVISKFTCKITDMKDDTFGFENVVSSAAEQIMNYEIMNKLLLCVVNCYRVNQRCH